MTDADNMALPSPADKPIVLIAGQDEISVEIDARGNLILRQQDTLGNDDTILIVRSNITAFCCDLIETVLPELADARPADPTARDRQRRHRERKRAGQGLPFPRREAAE
jgi:hypothetical protein